jgi:hypothetical protein
VKYAWGYDFLVLSHFATFVQGVNLENLRDPSEIFHKIYPLNDLRRKTSFSPQNPVKTNNTISRKKTTKVEILSDFTAWLVDTYLPHD